jgi:hypothetical protein
VGLWQDLSLVSQAEFEAVLDKLGSKEKPTKRAQKAKPTQPKDDRPVTRIAHQLRERASLPDELAMASLSAALLSGGVHQDLIPSPTPKLEDWLESLIGQISESRVMAAARRLKGGAERS